MLNDQWWTKKEKEKKETFRIVLSTWKWQWVHSTAGGAALKSKHTVLPRGLNADLISGVVRMQLCMCRCFVPTNLLASLPRFNLWYLAGTGPVAVISWLPSLFLELSLVSSVALNPCSEIRVGWFRMWVQQGWERNLPNKSVAWKELHLSALAVLFPLSQSLF